VITAQNIIQRAEEIVNTDSDLKLELDLRNQAVIHAICEALHRPGAVLPERAEVGLAEEALEEIGHILKLFHSKRLSWKEALNNVEQVLETFYGDESE